MLQVEGSEMSISVITNQNTLTHAVYPGKSVVSHAAGERQHASAGGNVLPQSAQTEVAGNDVARALRKIQEHAPILLRQLQFQVDENTSNAVITVLDASTNQVVRQIPTEEVIAIAEYLAASAPDTLSGLLLDGRG